MIHKTEIKNKQPERDEIARQTKEYEAKGNKIKRAKKIDTAPLNIARVDTGYL